MSNSKKERGKGIGELGVRGKDQIPRMKDKKSI
jgi:hypothetical protein